MEKRLSSDNLKIFAMLCMLIDHMGAGIVEKLYLTTSDPELVLRLSNINQVMRGIGRLAFPIFCYQIVVGFTHTHSRIRYVRNLLIFAILSEVPFDLLGEGVVFDINYQNVIITLLLGVLAIWAIDRFYCSSIYSELQSKGREKIYTGAFITAVTTVLSVVAELMKTDYGAKGVILIVLLFVFKDEKYRDSGIVPLLFIVEVFFIMLLRYKNVDRTLRYVEFEVYAVLAFLFTRLDNGVRHGGAVLKWIGYLFYPVHMLLIYFVGRIVLCMI